MGNAKNLMFPPSPKTVSKILDIHEFGSIFEFLWGKVEFRFFKLERLQAYQEPDDQSYQAFMRGDMNAAVKYLEERIAAQAPLYESMVKRGFEFVRVRAVELPISHYLHYEFKAYKISARYGEKILIVELTPGKSQPEFFQSSDYLLFDSLAVLIHRYDANGLLLGGWLIDNPAHVEVYVRLADELIKSAMPLGIYERARGLS